MELREEKSLLGKKIDFPVHYSQKHQSILDSKGMVVCDIGEWEKNQYMGTTEERLNAIGEKVVRLLNDQREKKTKDLDKQYIGAKINNSRSRVELFEWD